MTDNPTYTIAIPAFKGQYLRQCCGNVFKQVYIRKLLHSRISISESYVRLESKTVYG